MAGKPEGRRLQPWVYTGKILCSVNDWEKKIEAEKRRVRSLKNGGEWVHVPVGTRDKLYLDDPVTMLKGCGNVSAMHLHARGIRTIENLFDMTPEDEKELQKSLRGKDTIHQFIEDANRCELIVRPRKIDHRKHENPYLSRYGEEKWEEQIKKCTAMSKFVCVTDMIDHIVSETRRVFKGTTHEKTCMFYHDALSQMTATSCREWMKKKGYDKMWITPELGLFEEDPSLNPYRGRPVGNCPELSCLDSSLNRDVKVAVHDNVRFTSDVPVDDPRKFSLATPEEGTRAYLRVLEIQDPKV